MPHPQRKTGVAFFLTINLQASLYSLTQVYNKNVSFYNPIYDIPHDILRRLEFVSF